MAGEFAVINPRRRRRKKVRVRRRKSHRRKYARAHNPFRRRRHVARRRHNPRRRRYARRHNPSFMGINVGKVASIAGGYVGTEILAGYLRGILPANLIPDANMARIGSKALIGIGVPLLAKRFLPRGVANALMVGGGVAVAVDIFNTYIKPAIPGLPLSDYETGYISDYELAQVEVSPHLAGPESVYGESIY